MTKVSTLHILPITTLTTLYVHGQSPHEMDIAHTLQSYHSTLKLMTFSEWKVKAILHMFSQELTILFPLCFLFFAHRFIYGSPRITLSPKTAFALLTANTLPRILRPHHYYYLLTLNPKYHLLNNTLFSLVLHQLDALISNNLLTAHQLDYVQSQLNDRLEDFSFQLASHVQTISNASSAPSNNTFKTYTPPFPFYEYVMLFISSISILFSIFFLLFTYCFSRRLYHIYLVPDKYRPGKYAHTLQYLLILPLIPSSCAKPLPPDNLSLALWNHAQWESNHGIFIPSLQYRSSEAFFECMIFVFVPSTFCKVLYLLLPSKSGGRSPSSDSSMLCSKPTFYKRLSQTSLITLLSCSPNVKAYLASLANGTFIPLHVCIPDNWHYTPNATWEHISFDHFLGTTP